MYSYVYVLVDVELLVYAVKFAKKFMLTPPFDQYHLEFAQPGAEVCTDSTLR